MGLLTRIKASHYRKEEIGEPGLSGLIDKTGKKSYNYSGSGNFKAGSPARDFYINQEAPHHVWKPNEYICGEVVLVLKQSLENVAVTLSLVGEVKIRGLGPRTRSEKLFERSTVVYGEQQDVPSNSEESVLNGLTKGEHRFPFRLKLPSNNIFTSIKFERGSVSYCLRCTLEPILGQNMNKVIASCEKNISVKVPLDVSKVPKPKTKTVVLQSPSAVKHNKTEQDSSSSYTKRTTGSRNSGSTVVSSGTSKTVTISVDLPSSGYVIGEVIPIKLQLDHYREYSHSAGLIATLVRICRVGDATKENLIETYRKDICQTVSPIYVNPETLGCCVTVYLKVPLDAFPTLQLPNKRFTFQYYVEVLVNLSKKNLAYTESNRVVDTTNNSPVSNLPGKSIEETLTFLQRKMQPGLASKSFQDDDRESMIFYQDMINVDKLKRLRNVTGMSIEVVVGTTRSVSENEAPEQSLSTSPSAVLPVAEAVEDEHEIAGSTVAEHPTHPINSEDYTYTRESKRYEAPRPNYWFDHEELSSLPLPVYTPNGHINIKEDKDEMELQRLKELESEPPMTI
ncbi:LADA_0C09384g1_1 [Lachancea dasiensis]|uniref:pH-response regulator protein palF/RIM8 n=1 Tax=Lachancea dasiensis TaxID=1072105 RepID=A0A1G4J0F1_9SACH|nr:LADA_0C09384g1_1 [Lachancea dasiensis]